MCIKKILAYAGTVLFTWGGCIIGLFALLSDEPSKQGWLAITSALTFSLGVLCAGWGNSLCKKEEE